MALTRIICCFHTHNEFLIAHCHDGTIWCRTMAGEWEELAGIPIGEDDCDEDNEDEPPRKKRAKKDYEEMYEDLEDRVGQFLGELLDRDKLTPRLVERMVREANLEHCLP